MDRRFLAILLLVCLLVTPLLFSFVRAQEDVVVADEEAVDEAAAAAAPGVAGEKATQGLTLSSPDVQASSIFPEHADKKLSIGKIEDVLLGFSNNGPKTFKVEYIVGYLVSPQDTRYYIQNFTGFLYNVTIKPNEESTLLYRFRTDPRLEPREYGIVVDVFYRSLDNNRTYLTTFFNETVELVEVAEQFDPRSFFASVAIFGIFGLAGFGIYKVLDEKYRKKGKKTATKVAAPIETSTTHKKAVDDSWIPPHLAKYQRKAKPAASGAVSE